MIIVDDEPLARYSLSNLIAEDFPFITLLGGGESGSEALFYMKNYFQILL